MESFDEKLLKQRIEQLKGDLSLWKFFAVGFFMAFATAMFYILFTRVI